MKRIEVDYEDLLPTDSNSRRVFQHLEELAGQIAKAGLLQNLVVVEKNGKYEVHAGERRRRAIGILRLSEEEQLKQFEKVIGKYDRKVPVLVIEPAEAPFANLIENIGRSELYPWETGRKLAEWNDAGYDLHYIRSRIGKSLGWISSQITTARQLSPQVTARLEQTGDPRILSFSQLFKLSRLYDTRELEPRHQAQLVELDRLLGQPKKRPALGPRAPGLRTQTKVAERVARLARMKVPLDWAPFVEVILNYLVKGQKPNFKELDFLWKRQHLEQSSRSVVKTLSKFRKKIGRRKKSSTIQ